MGLSEKQQKQKPPELEVINLTPTMVDFFFTSYINTGNYNFVYIRFKNELCSVLGVGRWFTAQNACHAGVRTEDQSPLRMCKIQASLVAICNPSTWEVRFPRVSWLPRGACHSVTTPVRDGKQ